MAAPAQGAAPSPKAASAQGAATAEPGAELAAYYKTMRRTLAFESAHREASASASALLSGFGIEGGAGGPLLDVLPPPKAFLIPAAALALAAALAVLVRRARGRVSRRLPPAAEGHMYRATRPVAAIALAAFAALFLALAGAAALERRRTYAVAWTEELSAIPSSQAELRIEVRRGSTAELRLISGDYAALSFADGVVAWAPSAQVFEY